VAFGGFNRGAESAPMAEINMIPLIDVMLVLLVIFIITAPLLTHSVKIDLPKAASQPNLTRPDNIQLAVDTHGTVFWNGEAVDRVAWRARMQAAAERKPQPELHIHGDATATYGSIAGVLADAARAGLTRIGFVSSPDHAP
jgi:biopolymer transport protein ExbD